MKNKIIYLLVLSSMLLAGCFKQNNSSSSNSQSSQPSSGEQSSSEEKSSSSSSENTRPKTGTTTIEVYSTNDFHGAVEENGYEVGLARWGTFLKNKNQSENTLIIDQGDTWQGSIYSNFNKGALLTDVMNYVKFDARSVGNHDFDWGQEYIAINKNREYEGYTTPTLAGNVYDMTLNIKLKAHIKCLI
jgi:2',3'-cyclic-nucleotide 2'-phosphodiesterase (5'-nucleotidase family)